MLNIFYVLMWIMLYASDVINVIDVIYLVYSKFFLSAHRAVIFYFRISPL